MEQTDDIKIEQVIPEEDIKCPPPSSSVTSTEMSESLEKCEIKENISNVNEIKIETSKIEEISTVSDSVDAVLAEPTKTSELNVVELKAEAIPAEDETVTSTMPPSSTTDVGDVNDAGLSSEDNSKPITSYDTQDYEKNLREIITADNVYTMRHCDAREALEKRLGLEVGALRPQRKIIGKAIENILNEIDVGNDNDNEEDDNDEESSKKLTKSKKTSEIDGQEDEEADCNNKNKRRKVTSSHDESTTPGGNRRGASTSTGRSKKPVAECDGDSSSVSASTPEVDASSDEDVSSDNKKSRKRKAKAQPKRGLRVAQQRMMTKDDFLEAADDYDVKFGPIEAKCEPKVFNTGSCGWGYSGKIWLNVGGRDVNCMLSMNCTVVGSKEWKQKSNKAKVKSSKS